MRDAESLFAEFLEAGDGVQFDTWIKGHPEHEEDLRRIHADWRLLGATRKKGDSFFKSGEHERPQPAPGLEAGKVIGDFRLVELIGQGGMGQVWEAEQVSLRRTVALKFIRPDRLSEKQLAYFEREARAGARLNHPGIVAVHGFGMSDGVAWIAMEMVDGCWTLRDLLDDLSATGDVSADYYRRVTAFMTDLASALQAAHESSVIHRDLKPQNVLITSDDRPKLTDFGLARIEDEAALSVTGDFAGTFYYMSPEQVAARRIGLDHRTDIFSLGVVMYEMLALRRPFEGDTTHQIAEKVLMSEPPDLRKVRSRVPVELSVICGRMLEKRREDRYQTMAEVADELRRFSSHEPILATPPGPVQRIIKWGRRHPARSLASSVAVVGLVIIVVLLGKNIAANSNLKMERDVAQRARGRAERAESTVEEQLIAARKQLIDYGLLRALTAAPGGATGPIPRSLVEGLTGALAEAESLAADGVDLRAQTASKVLSNLASWLEPSRVVLVDSVEPLLTIAAEARRVLDGLVSATATQVDQPSHSSPGTDGRAAVTSWNRKLCETVMWAGHRDYRDLDNHPGLIGAARIAISELTGPDSQATPASWVRPVGSIELLALLLEPGALDLQNAVSVACDIFATERPLHLDGDLAIELAWRLLGRSPDSATTVLGCVGTGRGARHLICEAACHGMNGDPDRAILALRDALLKVGADSHPSLKLMNVERMIEMLEDEPGLSREVVSSIIAYLGSRDPFEQLASGCAGNPNLDPQGRVLEGAFYLAVLIDKRSMGVTRHELAQNLVLPSVMSSAQDAGPWRRSGSFGYALAWLLESAKALREQDEQASSGPFLDGCLQLAQRMDQHHWRGETGEQLMEELILAGRRPDALELGTRFIQHAADRLSAYTEKDRQRHVTSLNDLAWLLLTHSYEELQDAGRALALAQQALDLIEIDSPDGPASISQPLHAYVLDTLALAKFRTGELADALHLQRRACSIAEAVPGDEISAETREGMRACLEQYEQALSDD